MSYEFQSTLHSNLAGMLAHIAESWITADGANSAADIAAAWAACTDDQLAAEAVDGWGLDQSTDAYDVDAQSHMQRHGYDAADLARAFAMLRPSA